MIGPQARNQRQSHNIKGIRERERRPAERAEAAYRRLTDGWTQAGPRRRRARTGAAREERPS